MANLNNATVAAVAAAKAQASSASGRPAAYALSARIAVQTDGNPKKPGTASYDRFALYYTAEKLKFFSRRVFTFGPPGPILNVRR